MGTLKPDYLRNRSRKTASLQLKPTLCFSIQTSERETKAHVREKKYKQPIKVIKPKTKTKRVEKSQELTGARDEERYSSAPFAKQWRCC
jgi:hypothetical protein